MHTDDTPVGRLLSRREVVALLGLSSGALLTGRAWGQPVPSCVVRPQQTEGPFFVDERLNRSDIRSDPASGVVKPGVLLQVAFKVSRLAGSGCAPLAGAHVDVWHCDALGAYSDTSGWGADTRGQKFLRGYQVTDEGGLARFTTIYPGGYSGRAVHIHFKIRTQPAAARGDEFTSQLYFDDALTDRVHATPAYGGRGPRRVRNESDGPFRSGGRQLLLPLAERGQGYAGTFDIALDRSQQRRG
ncbi:MAG TPA: intradiol ring-cleavage dioxygenase [Methylomirabilota bacterium]|nr:intradiol ring-cleavage dioxygenase [Methylomirabilota bacterium]